MKVFLAEHEYDEELCIRTEGIREWKDQTESYNRYEATPYQALEILVKNYKIQETDKVVDFGSGRGRVSFFLHSRFQVPVTGIEMNDTTFDESLRNKASYLHHFNDNQASLSFQYGLAEHYEINEDENRFYFFNPFSVKIFKKVVNNILHSIENKHRSVDIILYYPLKEYKQVLTDTPFRLMNKIKVPGIHGKYGKFLIYRLDEKE